MATTSCTSQSENPNLPSMYDRVSDSPKREYIDVMTPNSTSHVYVERDNRTPSHQITQLTDRVYDKAEPEGIDIKQINGSSKNTRSNKMCRKHRTLVSDTKSSSTSNFELNGDNVNGEHCKIAQDTDFLCPICLDIIKEAFVGRCGHSFCYKCIFSHLDSRQDCPTCSSHLTRDQVYPNFLLNRILEKNQSIVVNRNDSTPSSPVKSLREKILKDDLSVEEIDNMVVTLLAKKQKIESVEREDELDLLFDFLSRIKPQEKLNV